jgi:hypothetical protein
MAGVNTIGSNLKHLDAVYCSIMNTVADRLDSIAEALAEVSANPDHPNNWRNAEFCYLQARKCVEYVALAILAAHRANDYECEKLENEYKADVIFSDLGKLNPHGFPRATQIKHSGEENVDYHIVQDSILSKRRMKRIYDACAVHLHSGKLSNILNQTIPAYNLVRVSAWREELATLLERHSVVLPHMGLVMIIWLRAPDTGRSKVVFVQADGPFKIEGDTAIYNDGDCE